MFEVLLVTIVLAVAIDDLRRCASSKQSSVGRVFYTRKRSTKGIHDSTATTLALAAASTATIL
jgi:hypothetical protein